MSGNTQLEIVTAGAVAALTVDLLVYPLDTIKTRLQSKDYSKKFGPTGTSGPMLRGLYQGVGSALVAMLPSSVVFFTTYESAKSMLGNAAGPAIPQAAVHAAASGVAEMASCIILTPAEVIKQNAQMIGLSSGESSTSMKALRMLWRGGGTSRRLWSGYTALASRNLPFTAMQFPMFEMFRSRAWAWRDRRRKQQKGPSGASPSLAETGLVTGLSAALSGSIAAVITTPTDVVKTRAMLEAGQAENPDGPTHNRAQTTGKMGGLDVAKQVFRDGGIRGFFRGALLRAVWTAIGSGLYLGTYEVAKLWLRHGQEDEL